MKNFVILTLLLIIAQSCKVIKKDSLGKTDSKPTINSNYVYLDDIKEGIGLDRAKIIAPKKYWSYIMENELGNPHNKPIYETVLATSDKIYFGVIKQINGTGKLVVDPFYGTDNEVIKEYFPGFEDIDGTNVQAKVFYSFFDKEIETKLKPACPSSYSFNYDDYDITLTDKGILVETLFQGKCYEDVVIGMELSTILNPKNLDVLQYYYVLKDKTHNQETEDGYISETQNVFKKVKNPKEQYK